MKKEKHVVALLIALALLGTLFAVTRSSKATPARNSKIRRTILLNFKSEATDADVQKILKDVKETISKLKGIHNLFIGRQTNERAPFKYGISMDFEDEAALKAYRTDQEHRRTHNQYNHLIEQAQITDIVNE
ncbi:MAG TPA: Dabb family protein [Nitrososphaera sp.]|nr:Dabb family protein [Nitrososphaera sp.]